MLFMAQGPRCIKLYTVQTAIFDIIVGDSTRNMSPS